MFGIAFLQDVPVRNMVSVCVCVMYVCNVRMCTYTCIIMLFSFVPLC